MASVPKLVCIGNITIDDAVLPDGRRRDLCLGGDALYCSLAARLFEPSVAMLAPIGSDLPFAAAAAMASAGFPPDMQPQRTVSTIRNVITYDDSGGRQWDLLSAPGDFDLLSVHPDDISETMASTSAFMVSAMSLQSQTRLMPWLRANTAATIYLDLQEDYISGNEDQVLEFIAHSHVFLPSEEEVRRLLLTDDWDEAVRVLAAAGPDIIVIKRAGHGSLVFDSSVNRLVQVPAHPSDVVDSTGAGDAFCGAFAAVHQRTGDAVHAARAGAVAASIAISDYGTNALLGASTADANALLSIWIQESEA